MTDAQIQSTPAPAPARRTLSSIVIALSGGVARGVLGAVVLHAIFGLGVVLAATYLLGLWNLSFRGASSVMAVVGIHASAIPFVLSASCMIAVASSIKSSRVGHFVAWTAMERAAEADPRLRELNDFPAIASGIRSAIDGMIQEARAQSGGLMAFARRHVVARIIRVVGWVTLRELDLYPNKHGAYEYAKIEDWIGARIDDAASETIRRGSVRGLAMVLVLQIVLTVATIWLGLPVQSSQQSNTKTTPAQMQTPDLAPTLSLAGWRAGLFDTRLDSGSSDSPALRLP